MLNDARTRVLFINLKPRCGFPCDGESPLSGADARCRQDNGDCRWGKRLRGAEALVDIKPWATTGETGPQASRVRDAERSDAVDGVRHQLSRAGPDLGLHHP